MDNLVNLLLFGAVLLWIVSNYDIKRISHRYWKTVPVNLYTVTAVYDVILHTYMNTDDRYRTLMMFSDMARTEIERELGKQRPDYLSLKSGTLGPQNGRRISHDEQSSYPSHGNFMVE